MDTTDVRDINKGIFLVRIVTWSHGQTFPKGRLVRNLGHAGDIAAESAAILAEHEIDSSPFSQEVVSDLPTFEGVWQVPDSEKPPPASASAKAAGKERPKSASGREDLTDLCIVSIDPESARDLDDALHCRPVGGGQTEVGERGINLKPSVGRGGYIRDLHFENITLVRAGISMSVGRDGVPIEPGNLFVWTSWFMHEHGLDALKPSATTLARVKWMLGVQPALPIGPVARERKKVSDPGLSWLRRPTSTPSGTSG